MKKKRCRDCGGPIVRGVDRDGRCTECRRLAEFIGDMSEGRYKSDHVNLDNANYRRYAHAG